MEIEEQEEEEKKICLLCFDKEKKIVHFFPGNCISQKKEYGKKSRTRINIIQ